MRLSFLIFSLSCHHVLQLALGNEITLTRHADGDVFTIPGSCNEACMVLSSDTASPFGSAPSSLIVNDSCTCQCNYGLPVFREDLRICVANIQECDVAGFVSSSGLVEKVPYVYLPQCEQIIYPQAEIKFEGVDSPVCVITGVQQLGRSGWSELRNVSDVEFPLSLYRDGERTFLQWTGEAKLREAAEGRIVVVKLACREDSYPAAAYRGVFTPCVAFRVAGSPSRSSIKEVSFSTSSPSPQGLTSAEYTAIGVSSVVLALIYVASVSLYLHSRKGRRKARAEDDEEAAAGAGPGTAGCPSDSNEGLPGLVKCNPLLAVGRHFESDTNSAVSETDLADKLLQSESESEVENTLGYKVTSAIIHPHEEYVEPQEQNCNSGPIIGERLPEEDVRVIETTENGNQQNMPIFPGTQRRKLYFNPAYFDRQLLLAPPPAAVEFLLKIREVISIAKHKMAAKRFVPTLNEIPEESSSERLNLAAQRTGRRRASSVQNGSVAGPLRCHGCPGCSHVASAPSLPTARGLAENAGAAISGESRVRAWLEDVKILDTRWRNLEEERAAARLAQRQQLQQQGKLGTRTREMRDVDSESARLSSKSLPPIFREISHKGLSSGCINAMFKTEECNRGPCTRRSTKSVTREPGYFERQADEVAEWARRKAREHEENVVNANVRRAIENSFKKQLEQLQSVNRTVEKSSATRSSESPVRDAEKSVVPHSLPEKAVQIVSETNSEKANEEEAKEIEETRVLLDIISGELSARSSSDAKRIMDAVIQELVVTKDKDKRREAATKASDYESDSLEKTKVSRKLSSSPVSTDKSSPALSSALPMDEELTMRNAIIDVQISETTATKTCSVVKNHNLPEVVPLRPENYALVSEVYVNDGYASPTGSDDDSGPEIQYESENPGHLTIKVLDSPKNYIKQDESEYEPDTLDRKPMKLKINGDITYEKDIVNEVYIDSLERSTQILLRSKRSFKEENGVDTTTKLPREYNSLREIYEARLKYQQQQQQQQQLPEQQTQPVQEKENDQSDSWRDKNVKYNSPLLPRHERRQRKADNQPDVVPNPPPPPPPELVTVDQFAKNAQDRSLAGAGDPTTCKDAPVGKEAAPVVGKPPAISRKPNTAGGSSERSNTATSEITDSVVNKKEAKNQTNENSELTNSEALDVSELLSVDDERRSEKRQQYRRFSKWRHNNTSSETRTSRSPDRRSKSADRKPPHQRRSSPRSRSRSRSKSRQDHTEPQNPSHNPTESASAVGPLNLEDSAYVSSPESNGSRRRLLQLREPRPSYGYSCTESDESTSGNGANSESGAESIETDSVFFGNFRARAERERLAAANCRRQSQPGSRAGAGLEQKHESEDQQRPINYRAFQIKSRVY